MRKSYAIFAFCLMTLAGCAVQTQKECSTKNSCAIKEIECVDVDYDKYFTENTLRFDFQHYGNSESEN